MNLSNAAKSILLIGRGRLAKHLKHWFQLLDTSDINFKTWDRSQSPEVLENYLQNSTIVWLAISDQALLSFFENTLAKYSDITTVHFSGSFHHEKMISAHPLMTFSTEIYTLADYQKIYFALTGSENLKSVMPGFDNQFFQISAEKKSLYHALCVVSGNLPQLLWSKSENLFSDLKIPKAATALFLQKSLDNFLNLGSSAVTGPLVRNDQFTINKNLNSLSVHSPELEKIYKSFLKDV